MAISLPSLTAASWYHILPDPALCMPKWHPTRSRSIFAQASRVTVSERPVIKD